MGKEKEIGFYLVFVFVEHALEKPQLRGEVLLGAGHLREDGRCWLQHGPGGPHRLSKVLRLPRPPASIPPLLPVDRPHVVQHYLSQAPYGIDIDIDAAWGPFHHVGQRRNKSLVGRSSSLKRYFGIRKVGVRWLNNVMFITLNTYCIGLLLV